MGACVKITQRCTQNIKNARACFGLGAVRCVLEDSFTVFAQSFVQEQERLVCYICCKLSVTEAFVRSSFLIVEVKLGLYTEKPSHVFRHGESTLEQCHVTLIFSWLVLLWLQTVQWAQNNIIYKFQNKTTPYSITHWANKLCNLHCVTVFVSFMCVMFISVARSV